MRKITPITLQPWIVEAIDRLAENKKQSRSRYIENILRDYLKQLK